MGPARQDVVVAEEIEALCRILAESILRQIKETLQGGGVFSLVLSGGSTPRHLYCQLAGDPFRYRIPWERVHFFWGDERHVPPEHPESNYRLAHDAMLSRVPVPGGNIHRVQGESRDAENAARAYETEIRRFFGLDAGGMPIFDCVLLGLGADGHTASLFSETDALKARGRLVVANWVEALRAFRITMTLPVINNARSIRFLVSGADKAEALRLVLKSEARPDRLPARLVRPLRGRLHWYVDAPAARLLGR